MNDPINAKEAAEFHSPKSCFEAFIAAKRAGDDLQMLDCYTAAKSIREIGVVIMEIAANVFMETDLKAKTLELLASHGVSEFLLRDIIENGPARHGSVMGALDTLGKRIASPKCNDLDAALGTIKRSLNAIAMPRKARGLVRQPCLPGCARIVGLQL